MEKFIKEISLDSREREIEKKATPIPSIKADKIIKQFKENINSVRAKLLIYNNLVDIGRKEDADDILRCQIVFLESALDFYLHEIVKYGILKMLKGEKPKTASYKNTIVFMETLESAVKFPENIESIIEDDIINSKYHSQTFMSCKGIKEIFSKITNTPVFKNVSIKLGMTEKELADKLEELYKRRNKIVHQSDRDHKTATLNRIDRNEVTKYIDLVEKFIVEAHILLVGE
jgi:uncharacterized protein YutE (UPF0331/DUF86 family)